MARKKKKRVKPELQAANPELLNDEVEELKKLKPLEGFVECMVCHKKHLADSESFIKVQGNVYIGWGGGIIGHTFACKCDFVTDVIKKDTIEYIELVDNCPRCGKRYERRIKNYYICRTVECVKEAFVLKTTEQIDFEQIQETVENWD